MLIIVIALSPLPAATVPVPVPVPQTSNQINNAYSGVGGKASGGSVTHTGATGLAGLKLLEVFSSTSPPLYSSSPYRERELTTSFFTDNAGDGGEAKSGNAMTSSGAVNVTGDATSGATSNVIGNSYSGAGGTANGGNVDDSGALISLFSGVHGFLVREMTALTSILVCPGRQRRQRRQGQQWERRTGHSKIHYDDEQDKSREDDSCALGCRTHGLSLR